MATTLTKLSTCSVEGEDRRLAFWRQGACLGTVVYQDRKQAAATLNGRIAELQSSEGLRLALAEPVDLNRNDLEIISLLLSGVWRH